MADLTFFGASVGDSRPDVKEWTERVVSEYRRHARWVEETTRPLSGLVAAASELRDAIAELCPTDGRVSVTLPGEEGSPRFTVTASAFDAGLSPASREELSEVRRRFDAVVSEIRRERSRGDEFLSASGGFV